MKPSDIHTCSLEIFVLGFFFFFFFLKASLAQVIVSQKGNEEKKIYRPGYFSFGWQMPKNKLLHEKSSVSHEKPMRG